MESGGPHSEPVLLLVFYIEGLKQKLLKLLLPSEF